MGNRLFGVSTRMFRDTPLAREHLVHIAAHGFEAVEIHAATEHVDVRNPETVAQLAEWLADTRLHLHSVHAPAAATLDQIESVIDLAEHIPYSQLVVHRPTVATERTLQQWSERATARKVGVAIELRNQADSNAPTLVTLLEEELDGLALGICLDFGHANLAGDVDDAIEVVSGHLATTHVHDNGGRRDDRLVPYGGRIQWDTAMMELQKIGYDGPLIFEYNPSADPVDVLRRTMKARERLEKAFVVFY